MYKRQVGFTPKLVAGVWVGFDTPRTIIKNGFGGDLAVPIWTQFMLAATKGDENSWFQPPPDVVAMDVCRLSGDRPAAGCRNAVSVSRTGEITNKSMVYTEYFVRGTEPAHTCAVHAAPYMPYSEPYFAVSAFQELELLSPEISLPVRAAPPDPVPVAVPAAPRLQENPASALPPPAPPESPPAVP